MPAPLSKALVGWKAVLVLAALVGALGGCEQEGKTPTCKNNVTADGQQSGVEDACNEFGKCIIDGKVRPAAECCEDEQGEPLTGARLDVCLYGYGEFDLPQGEGGSGGAGGSG